MRVLVIGQLPKEVGGNYTTGAANVVYELSKANKREGYHTFATNISEKAAQISSEYKNQYIGYSYRPLSLIMRMLLHPLRFFRNIRHYKKVDHQNWLRYYFYEDNIYKAIQRVSPEIIHCHSVFNLSPTRFALGGKNIPIIVTCHGISYKGDQKDEPIHQMYQGNLPLADYYTGSTKETAWEYEHYLGIPQKDVLIIPNGIDYRVIHFDEGSRNELRKEYGVKDNQIVFLTIASVQERKGQVRFLHFLKNLQLDYQFWIIGDGPDMPKVKQFINENEMENTVKLIGYVNGNLLYKYYSAADVYAHTSTNEGQALVEIGANATGLKCLVSNEIKNTVSGDISSDSYFVLDFHNPDYESITMWLKNNYRSQGTIQDWSEIAERYNEFYSKILNTK